MNLSLRAMLAGLCFGLWPLFMNRSNIQGSLSSTVFCAIVLLAVLPAAFTADLSQLGKANWSMAIIAGVVSGVGLLAFNSAMAKATIQSAGMLFMVMIMVQITVPAIYHVYQNGLTPTKAAGIAAAIIAAALLSR